MLDKTTRFDLIERVTRSKLPRREKAVLNALIVVADESGACNEGAAALGALIGLHLDRVRFAINNLNIVGLLTIKGAFGGGWTRSLNIEGLKDLPIDALPEGWDFPARRTSRAARAAKRGL